jgi:ketosteroid isomerase-like protein
MSEENVEIGEPARRLWAALGRRDWNAFSAELDPDLEYRPVEENVIYRGSEEVVQYAERWLEPWDAFLGEVEEVTSAPGEDRAFLVLHFRGRGTESGVEIDDRLFWVFKLRRGRLYRIREYSDRAEALVAAGLRE